MKRRTDLHLARKLWHVGAGLAGLSVYAFTSVSQPVALAALATFLTFSIGMELVRLRSRKVNAIVRICLNPILRREELVRVSGVPYFVAAAFLVVLFFPKPVAILSLLYLTLGDPAASIVGILCGHWSVRYPNGKSLVGALAASAICIAVSFPVLQYYGVAPQHHLPLALGGGVAAGFAEVAPIQLDDNFLIPIVSAIVLMATSWALGGVGWVSA